MPDDWLNTNVSVIPYGYYDMLLKNMTSFWC